MPGSERVARRLWQVSSTQPLLDQKPSFCTYGSCGWQARSQRCWAPCSSDPGSSQGAGPWFSSVHNWHVWSDWRDAGLLVLAAQVRCYLPGVNGRCGSLPIAPFCTWQRQPLSCESVWWHCPKRAAGGRVLSRKVKFRDSQTGGEKNPRSMGAHFLCLQQTLAFQTLSHWTSPNHFLNEWTK